MTDDTVEYMLTTVDNPFDPFTQFQQWLTWDTANGYDTPGLLDRVVVVSDEMSEADQSLAIQEGIDEIVRENVLGLHRKVSQLDMQPAENFS